MSRSSDRLGPLPDFPLLVLDNAKVTHLPALAQGLGSFEINTVQVPVIDNVAVAEHPTEALQQIPFPELVLNVLRKRLTLKCPDDQKPPSLECEEMAAS